MRACVRACVHVSVCVYTIDVFGFAATIILNENTSSLLSENLCKELTQITMNSLYSMVKEYVNIID